MFVCPNCGLSLGHPVKCGLSHCANCNVVCSTSEFHKLLSWAWEIRNGKDIDIVDRDQILSIQNYNLLKTAEMAKVKFPTKLFLYIPER